MPRPREFDIDRVLDGAMHVFWAKGYEATSLDELCEATGLGRSSLYAAFGSKRRLYFDALERYESRAVDRVAAALSAPLPIRKAIAAFLGKMIEEIVAGHGRRGCLIGNCAAELSRNDRQAAGRVRQSLERVEETFRAGLARARGRGELSAKSDVDALARFLTSGIQGLRLVGKTNPDRAVLEDIAQVMLRCLDT